MDVIDLHKMQREEGISSPLSVALGNFDGVHKGHAELISHAVAYAKKHGIRSAVWTFSDEAAVLPNKPGVKRITTTKEKLELFRELGVDYAILEEFSAVREFAPEKFVREMLVGECHAVCAVCGFNFRFGALGAGDSEKLKELMAPLDSIVVPPVYVDGMLVSSTAVRACIENGDMKTAEALLGRPFSLELDVVEGKRLGRTIGMPTINQNFRAGYVIPKGGVYACTVNVDGEEHLGVANIGTRPTIKADTHAVNCETHIIGYEGCLYGRSVRVTFYRRLRDELHFEGVDALKNQVKKDIKTAEEYFSK